MADMQINGAEIVIKKKQGLTYGLLDLVKSNPNSILSDGKITLKEWNAAIDKLIEIQDKRIKENKQPIFSGGTDRKDYRKSFVVHPNQKIEFTADEMKSLYSAMGVTFKNTETPEKNDKVEETSNTDETNSAENVNEEVTQAEEAASTDAADDVDETKNVSPVEDTTEEEKTSDETKTDNTANTNNKDKRFSLSWQQIGEIAGSSAVNFVKGMFCDENGFSAKRTAMTVGTVGALALAAPVAAAAGASAAVVGGIALGAKLIGAGIGLLMAGHGTVNAVKGTKAYLNSKTEEDAKASMSQAMDGAVEAAAAVPTFFALKGITNKTGKFAVKEAKAGAKPAEPKPAEPKPAEPAPIQPSAPKTPEEQLIAKLFKKDIKSHDSCTSNDGTSNTFYRSGRYEVEVLKDADGNIIKYIETKRNLLDTKKVCEIKDANGNFLERATDRIGFFTEDTKLRTIESADGSVTTVKFYSNRNVKEIITKKADGTTKVENFDKKGNLITENSKKNKSRQSEQNDGEPEILKYDDGSSYEIYKDAKGRKIKEISKDADGNLNYEEVTTYNADGAKNELLIWGSKSTTERIYNKDGNLIKEIGRHSDGQFHYEEVFTYKADGTKTKLTTWADKSTYEYHYNQDGYKTMAIFKDANNNLLSTENYKLDAAGKTIETITEFSNGLKYKFKIENSQRVSEGVGINPDGTTFKVKFENNTFSKIE